MPFGDHFLSLVLCALAQMLAHAVCVGEKWRQLFCLLVLVYLQ